MQTAMMKLASTLCCFAMTALAIANDAADGMPGRDVQSVRAWVLERNPELRSMALDAEAAAARPRAAGAFPDPMLSIEFEGIARDEPRIAPDEVGETMYQVRQRFPFWGKRSLSRKAAEADAQSAAGMRDAFALTILAEAEQTYTEYWYAARATEVIDRLIGVVADLEALARARYATGLAPMQDSLKAQVERTAMQRDRIELEAMRAESAAMLNAVLGRGPAESLAEPAGTPDLPVRTSYETLLARAGEAHPELRAAQQAVSAAEFRRRLTYRNRFPDLTVGVAPVQMGDRVDTWNLMLELDIPLQQGSRRAEEHERRAMEAAAIAKAEAVRTQLTGEVGSRWAQWQAAQRQLALIETTLLPQSEANYRAAVASYRVGAVDFGTLLEALREWRGAELQRYGATRDVLTRAAVLRALSGSLE